VVELVGDETVFAFEGCLSVSGWQSIVPRSRRVRLRALELLPGGGLREVDEEHTGWTARILQHETDHLGGVLCHDRMVPRSFVEAGYAGRYADLGEAVRRLGLEGEITRLGEGEVVLRR
jgi:peptide deformylase